MGALPSGIVTFLFTDIEGSTRLLSRLGPRYSELLDEHHRLLRAAFESHGGVEANTEGDAFFVAFHRPTDAVAACLDGQRALAGHGWPEDGGFRVRMGLHTGEAEVRNDDYVGLAVHLAARIASAGHGGQVLLSDTTARLVAGGLPPGATLRELGRYALKDFPEPECIHQLVHTDLADEFGPLKATPANTDHLPRSRTSFVGRELELRELQKLLDDSSLVTVVGAGGVGKTRIALEGARRAGASNPDGVWMVELAALSEPDLLGTHVLTTVGYASQPGRRDVDVLVENLRTSTALLVIDNCEHLVDACAQLIDRLLTECPDVTILATSREPLGVAGEHPWRLPSLPVPEDRDLPLEALADTDAVRLFAERAALVRPGFSVDEENVESVVSICRRLDGIPLAIELAAARARTLSIDAISSRLDDRFALLTGGSRTALSRQQTLRALVDWSYDLLSDAERQTLRRLSVFTDGFTIDAAEIVIPDADATGEPVLDLVGALVDKSLIGFNEATGRFRMLETVRHYATEKLLGEGDEATELRNRHLLWSLGFVAAQVAALNGPREIAAMDALETESGNLHAALEWAIASRSTEEALTLAVELRSLWGQRGRFVEGHERMTAVLALPGGPAGLRARAMVGRARLSMFLDREGAAEEMGRALAAADDSGDLAARTTARGFMAYAADTSDEALRWFREARDLALEMGDLGWQQSYMVQEGRSLANAGDLLEARRTLDEAMAIAESLDSDNCRLYALFHRGLLKMRTNELDAAAKDVDQALELATKSGDPRLQADCHSLRADLHVMQSAFDAARADVLEMMRLQRRMGLTASAAFSLTRLAYVDMAQGSFGHARACLDEALPLARGSTEAMQWVVAAFGDLQHLDGKLADAEGRFREVIATWPESSRAVLYAQRNLGRLALERGDLRAALGHYQAAMERTVNDASTRAIAVHIAALAAALDRPDLAAESLAASGPPDDAYLYAGAPMLASIRDEVVARLTDIPAASLDSSPSVPARVALLRRILDELSGSRSG